MKPLEKISVSDLKGVGPKVAAKLHAMGIFSASDVLFHLPLRYQDRTRVSNIGSLQIGDDVVIEGTVRGADIVYGKRRSLVVRIEDSTGLATLRFFHFSASQKNSYTTGRLLRCFGECRRGSSGIELFHPECQAVDAAHPAQLPEALTPIYPSSDGLQQRTWLKLCNQVLAMLNPQLLEDHLQSHLPHAPSLAEALQYLHRPPTDADTFAIKQGVHPCQQRLIIEELVAHHLSMLNVRSQLRSQRAPLLAPCPDKIAEFLKSLPFTPTKAQSRVAEQVSTDLDLATPMLRLVQGDVGSGKTLIAAMAALQAVNNGWQAAIMAPTEILAEQHLLNFQAWFAPMGLRIGWLVGKLTAKQKREQLALVASGDFDIVIGTHAIFQKNVEFAHLGLVVIDEQHRFGVHQRLQLKEKGENAQSSPHQLIMTATPIPRTLAMTAYADLDVSVIDELPPGRKPVKTALIDSQRRQAVIERVRVACDTGQQAYWVCTMIEESETLQAQAAEEVAKSLIADLPQMKIGLVHGRLKAAEKAAIMAQFKSGELQMLVATTVIEVGVDVPNANLMIIENPERLGLAQLHQLRGRVGRGSTQSHCVLLYQSPLSHAGKARLTTLRDSNDGFHIAQRDLELRGPGEVLGTRQTGEAQFRIADLLRDSQLLDEVKRVSIVLHKQPAARNALISRWMPLAEQFAQV